MQSPSVLIVTEYCVNAKEVKDEMLGMLKPDGLPEVIIRP